MILICDISSDLVEIRFVLRKKIIRFIYDKIYIIKNDFFKNEYSLFEFLTEIYKCECYKLYERR